MGQYVAIASAPEFDGPGATISPAIEEFASLIGSWYEEFPSLNNMMLDHLDTALAGFSGSEEPSEAEEELQNAIYASRSALEEISLLAAQSEEESKQGFKSLLELCQDLDQAVLRAQENGSQEDLSVFEKLIDWIKERLSGQETEPPTDLPERFDEFLAAFTELSDNLSEDSGRLCQLANDCPSLASFESADLPLALEDFGLGYSALLDHCDECPAGLSDELRSKIAVALEEARA